MKKNADLLGNLENGALFMEDYRPISKLIDMKALRISANF